MKIKSIYQSMELGAEGLPDQRNIKLLLRHSIRGPIINAADAENALLTHEGIILAQYFGRNIQYSIGDIHCSNVRRCVQTVENMIIGSGGTHAIFKEELLSTSLFSNDDTEAQISIAEYGLKRIVSMLANDIQIPGVNSLDHCVGNILDLIFSTGNVGNTLDIYCTHDIHIAMVIARMFNITRLHEIRENWPYMLEGVFLWGGREDLHVCWRERTIRARGILLKKI